MLTQVEAQALDLDSQLIEQPQRRRFVQVHIGNRGQVDLGPLELANGRPQDLTLLAWGPLRVELDDGAAHGLKLGRLV